MEPWTGAQHAFVVKAFYKNGDSSVIAQRTPENIAVVREAIERSPHRSVHRHSVSLGLSEISSLQSSSTPHSSGVET